MAAADNRKGYDIGGVPQLPPQQQGLGMVPPSAAPPDDVASHAGLSRLLGKVRGTQIGRMVSRYQDPGASTAVKRLHGDLRGLAQEGEPGRMWYEKSSKRLLDYVQGNKDEAHKLAQLIAIYSPQTTVDVNTANAIKSYNRAKSGEKLWAGDILHRDKTFKTIKEATDFAQSLGNNVTKVPLDDSGKRFLFARHNMGGYENIATADRDLKAHLLMNEGIPFEGRKTNNFYRNLMTHIDPPMVQGSTQDLWMARAFGFHDDAVSGANKYDFMEKLTHKLGRELGWKPHQVQAGIWTAMKTRQEATKGAVMEAAITNGIATFVPGDKGKPKFQVNPGQEDAYSSLQRQHALSAVLDPGHIARSARDFSDFLDQNLAHVSWEATPSKKIAHLQGLEQKPPQVKADYHKRISEALQDEQGNDLLAKYLGVLSPGTVEAPGYWEGNVNPASHTQIAATRIKAAGQRPDIDEASKKLMGIYADARGLLLKQDGVGYHRPYYNPKVTAANGVEYKFNHALSGDQIRDLGQEIDKIPQTALIPSGPDTVRVINFGGHADHRPYHKAVDRALQGVASLGTSSAEKRLFASDGDLRENDWSTHPHGQDYRSRLGASARPDVLEYLSSVLAPKVQAVDEDFAKEHGLKRDTALEQALLSYDPEGRLKRADGGSIGGDQPDRPLSPLGLYSHAGALASTLPQEKGAPDQFKAMLAKRGVKPDEIATSGFDQAFAGKKSVTKHEVARHFHENLPDVKETVLGHKDVPMLRPVTHEELSVTPTDHQWVVKAADGRTANVGKGTVSSEAEARAYAHRYLNERAEEINARRRQSPGDNTTKYHTYQLPGGSNYREHLLHLPVGKSAEADAITAKMNDGSATDDDLRRLDAIAVRPYKSSHWDVPNVLAHLRLSDRKGPKGEKILHLEELQSDWAQEGRKKGFRGKHETVGAPPRFAVEETPRPDLGEGRRTFTVRDQNTQQGNGGFQTHEAAAGHAATMNAAEEERRGNRGVPRAPYVDNTQKWVDLGLKRVLHEAAKGGYDKVVITPGEEQAKRYDLSKHIKHITYTRPDANSDGGSLTAMGHDGNAVVNQFAPVSKLPDIIGKEAADKLLATKPEASTIDKSVIHRLANQDLKVGGEGMKAFYDTILPRSLEKLAKQHDPAAKVALHDAKSVVRSKMDKYEKLHSLDITPAMRASILRGQAAYAEGGAVNHRPTDAQKAAGNYAKERVSFQGIPISIENKKGSTRSGVDGNGKRWSARLPADYGYIRGTTGADGDHVDAYLGPVPDSPLVVVVNQRDHRSGKFDEHKALLGWRSEKEAVDAYVSAFSDGKGRARIGSVESMSLDAFKRWLKAGKNTKPASSRAMIDRALALRGV